MSAPSTKPCGCTHTEVCMQCHHRQTSAQLYDQDSGAFNAPDPRMARVNACLAEVSRNQRWQRILLVIMIIGIIAAMLLMVSCYEVKIVPAHQHAWRYDQPGLRVCACQHCEQLSERGWREFTR